MKWHVGQVCCERVLLFGVSEPKWYFEGMDVSIFEPLGDNSRNGIQMHLTSNPIEKKTHI